MAQPVLHFMIVGQDDHPLFEADLVSRSDASGREVRVERAGGGRRQGLGAGATALPTTAGVLPLAARTAAYSSTPVVAEARRDRGPASPPPGLSRRWRPRLEDRRPPALPRPCSPARPPAPRPAPPNCRSARSTCITL